jgi:hypothetical protein
VEFLMADPVVGEALAVLHMVEFCRDNGFSSIVLEGDSLLVVQAINNTGVNWSRIGFIIDDIRNILKGFQWWKICHTKRQENRAAHTLAPVGVQQALSRTWIDCTLDFIFHIIVSKFSSLMLLSFYALFDFTF